MPPKISRKDLLSELHRLTELLGRRPAVNDLREEGEYTPDPYYREFGSFTNALESAGLDADLQLFGQQIPRESLINELENLAERIDRPPRQDDMDELGTYSSSAYFREFGGWNAALEEIGVEPDQRQQVGLSETDLKEELERLYEKLGRSPTYDEMGTLGNISTRPYEDRYGSWATALKHFGFTPREALLGEFNHSWTPEGRSYGPGWTEIKRRNVRERDGHVCQDPACEMSQEDHLETYNQKLHVHHIRPIRKFDDKKLGNRMENLITLCHPCHLGKWEQMAPLRPDTRTTN